MSPMDRRNYHPNWDGISDAIIQAADHRCELCGAQAGTFSIRGGYIVLTVHHIDGNPKNNSRQNLIALCQLHHLRLDRGLRSSRRAKPDLTWPGGLT